MVTSGGLHTSALLRSAPLAGAAAMLYLNCCHVISQQLAVSPDVFD